MTTKKYDNKHLTENERKIIQTGIENRCRKVDIARTIAKDPTTIAKEIRTHRTFKPRNTFNNPSVCIHRFKCNEKCQYGQCSNYSEQICKKRDRSPGACNKCPDINKCRLDKYFYYATKAHKEYRKDLIDFRTGINLTVSERKRLADTLKPLFEQRQSVYQILSSHKEITQSERTIYNYINDNVFHEDGITYFHLKEKVQRKKRYQGNKLKKRKEPVNYDGRKYSDYKQALKDNPNTPVAQMDLVYNNQSGPYIQTFMFGEINLMIGAIHQAKTSESMSSTLDKYEERLGHSLFRKLFSILLTDRGVEFQKNELFEFNGITGELRLQMFYCDPQQSQQKPFIENNHNYVRDIIPNKIDITNFNQADIDLMFSHINNTPRKKFNGKSPIEMLKFLYGDDAKIIMKAFNLIEVKRDEVVLKPYLIKTNKNKI